MKEELKKEMKKDGEGVVIYASAGVLTNAQTMVWCMGGSLFVYVCSYALGIFSDPPSILLQFRI